MGAGDMNSRKHAAGVAAGHQVTADAAAELLADGGNAFDAVCAGMMTACIAEPVLASPGGGGFLMAFDAARGRTGLVDFFAQTPRRHAGEDVDVTEIVADFGTSTQAFHVGVGCVATPGVVPGLFRIHRERGRVPLARVMEPAIRAASDGVVVTTYQAHLSEVAEAIVTFGSDASAHFAPSGETWAAGDVVTNAALADTLDCLVREGERFYAEGELGQAIAQSCAEGGGHLSAEDLRHYAVKVREPLTAQLREHAVHLNPAPSLGGVMIALSLRLLQADRTAGAWPPTPVEVARSLVDVDRLRAFVPALQQARREAAHRAARRHPHGEGPAIPEAWSEAATLSGLLDETDKNLRAALEEAAQRPFARQGTTHISVVDHVGNAAALTLSNGTGCGRMVPGCGFMMNNMLGEVDVTPQGAQGPWATDVRLASMMAPTLLALPRRGGHIALGSGGSSRIRSAILQVLLQLSDTPDALDEAVHAPRVHGEASGAVDFEAGFREDLARSLLEQFPEATAWGEPNMYFGGVHAAARRDTGDVRLAADPRRDGATARV